MSLSRYLRKQSKPILVTVGIALVVIAFFLDRITNLNLSSLCFYLIPASFFAWFLTRRLGVIASVVCAVIWIAGHALVKAHTSYLQNPYLNISLQLVFFFLVIYLICMLKESLGINEKLSRTDVLTGAMNRNAFYDMAQKEIFRFERYKHPFTVAYIDIDNFKVINYRFGHNTGDQLLRSITEVMRKNLRHVDLVSRLGGDEFTILLPETGAEAAQVVLSRIRNVLLNIMEKNAWPVTFTFGTVTFLKTPSSVEEMMKKVGSVMYSAKDSGMNTIEQEIVDA